MGFSTVISQIIFFSFMLVVLVGIFMLSKTALLEDKSSLEAKKDQTLNSVNSRVEIQNVSYSSGKIEMAVKNTGSTTQKPDTLDFYVNSERVPRNSSGREIAILEPDIMNPRLWDSDEQISVKIPYSLADGNHTIKIITEHGASDTKIFEVT